MLRRILFIALVFGLHGSVRAQGAPPSAQEAELRAAFDAATKVAKPGPTDIPLTTQGTLRLPEGYVFVPQPEANRILTAMGNNPGGNLNGLIFPDGEGKGSWWVTVDFIAAGYVRDEEAQNWNAAELLQSLKDGTEAGNAGRIQRGFQAIEVVDWAEPPAYDSAAHKLVWAATVRDKGAPLADETSVNYNTYALGREGYFSLNLITGAYALGADKAHAQRLLGGLQYVAGKGYGDFVEGTDNVAAYGIGALIAGAAAKKLGLLAVIGVFLLKFWKVAAVGAMAIAWAASKFFRRKS